MEWIFDPQAWLALLTLTTLEIVLGIDNIVFLTILVGRLPEQSRDRARTLGLLLAMGMRILLLLSISWIMKLTAPLFQILEFHISGRDLILLFGGLFLIAKSTHEIHTSLEGEEDEKKEKGASNFISILIQIMLIDMIFSLDSVITAVGLAKEVQVMIIAVVISVGIMIVAAGPIGKFVEAHPTLKMLALSFLILIGVALIGEGLALHIPKGYIYFAMAFSIVVEFLNMKARHGKKPVKLRSSGPKPID